MLIPTFLVNRNCRFPLYGCCSSKLLGVCGGGGRGMGEGSVILQISIYKMSKSWELNVQHVDYSEQYCTI